MKIRLEHSGSVFEYSTEPMPQKRFNALCKLGGFTIGGAILLGAIHMIGAWAIAWAVGALVLVGLYKTIL